MTALAVAAAVIAAAVGMMAALLRTQPAWTPVRCDAIDLESLAARMQDDLKRAESWPEAASAEGVVISTGFLPDIPVKAYRSDVILDADLDEVVGLIADDIVTRLPEWNQEFETGEILDVLEEAPDRKAWRVRIIYATPPPLRDREYVHYLARIAIAPDTVLIAYHSVDDGPPPDPKTVRAYLHRTVHLCHRLADGRTRVTHLLATDIGGWLPHALQNTVFTGSLVAANLRDSIKQQSIVGQGRPGA